MVKENHRKGGLIMGDKASCSTFFCFIEDAKTDPKLLHEFYAIISVSEWAPGHNNDQLLTWLHEKGYTDVDDNDLKHLHRIHKDIKKSWGPKY